MNNKHLQEVFSDEAFVKSLFNSENCEEVQEKLAKKDVDLSIDEIKRIIKILNDIPDPSLSEEQLESIAGGTDTVCLLMFCTCTLALGGVTGGYIGYKSSL